MTGLAVHPVGPERWGDLERLFGPSGAYSGCWCLFWRIPGAELSANGNAGSTRALIDGAGCQGFMGLASAFRRAGFEQVAPPVRGQVVMRYGIA